MHTKHAAQVAEMDVTDGRHMTVDDQSKFMIFQTHFLDVWYM